MVFGEIFKKCFQPKKINYVNIETSIKLTAAIAIFYLISKTSPKSKYMYKHSY